MPSLLIRPARFVPLLALLLLTAGAGTAGASLSGLIFADGFEAGGLFFWSRVVGEVAGPEEGSIVLLAPGHGCSYWEADPGGHSYAAPEWLDNVRDFDEATSILYLAPTECRPCQLLYRVSGPGLVVFDVVVEQGADNRVAVIAGEVVTSGHRPVVRLAFFDSSPIGAEPGWYVNLPIDVLPDEDGCQASLTDGRIRVEEVYTP